MTNIKAGDWILIPKGTQLTRDWSKGYSNDTPGQTSRDVTVQVSNVEPIDGYYMRGIVDDAAYEEYDKTTRQLRHVRTYGAGITDEMREADQLTKEHARLKALSTLPCGSTHFVYWSGGKKSVLNNAVSIVAAPSPRKKVEPKVNLRQQMVAKSRWKFTQDHDVMVKITNPQLGVEMDAWDKANPSPKRPPDNRVIMHGRPTIIMPSKDDSVWAAYHTDRAIWDKAREVERKAIHARHVAEVDHVLFSVKAGDVFEVTGRFTTSARLGREWLKGQFLPAKFDNGKETKLPYSSIKDVIEADSIPTVDIYVFRDKDTGLFMQTYPYGNSQYVSNPESVKGNWLPGSYVYKGMVNQPEMTDKFMKAKHFDNLGKLKTSLLNISGYYDGLNTNAIDNSRGYDTSYEKQMDLPENWEVVKFDKLARKEVEVIDIHAWYKRAYELRELTLRFGSSVRTVYQDLEKRNELDIQKGVIVFTVSQTQREEGLDYGDKTAFTDDQLKSIDDLIERLEMKKGTYRRGKDAFTQSISFKDKGVALMAKLSYSGSLKLSVLDLETLKEAVDD